MQRTAGVWVMVLGMAALWSAAGLAQEPAQARLLCGFDTLQELNGITWDVDHELVTDKALVTQGTGAVKLTFRKGQGFPGFTLGRAMLSGWRDYDLLRFEINNLSDVPLEMGIRFDDAGTRDFQTRAHFYKTFRPGPNSVAVPLKSLVRENGRAFDVGSLRTVIFLVSNPKRDYAAVLDDLRLENEKTVKIDVPGARLFDFGAERSMQFPGFVKVTENEQYDKEKGLGFVQGRISGAGRAFPDDLAGDYVESGGAFTFRVDLPDGAYRVEYIAHNPDADYDVSVGGAAVSVRRNPEKLFTREGLYQGIDDDYYPNKDLWKLYVEPDYPTRTADVVVRGGALEVTCRNCRLSSLVLYPVAQAEAMKPVLTDVMTRRRQQFKNDYCTVELPKPNGPAPVTGEDYLVFLPRRTDTVYPSTVPSDDTAGNKLTLAAARGQREPATFAVYPAKAVGKFTVAADDLVGPEGARIAAANVDVRLVRYFEKKSGDATYVPRPMQLVKRDTPFYPGFTRQYWVAVEVPVQSKPGLYRGRLLLTADGQVRQLAVELTVYPFELPAESRASFGYYYQAPFGANHLAAGGKTFAELLEPELIDMKRHGLNTLQLPMPRIRGIQGDRVDFDFDQLETYVALMKKHGIGAKNPPQMSMINLANYLGRLREFSPRFDTVLKNSVADIDGWFKARGMEVLLWVVDEPREQALNAWNRNLRDTMRYLELYRQVPGVKTTVTPMGDANFGVDYTPMVPLMDVIQTHPWPGSARLMELARKAGRPTLHLYNAGSDRLSYGLYLWKVQAVGRWQWHYEWPDTGYLPFKGFHWAVVYPSPEGPVPTMPYEQVAMGITDYKYLELLGGVMARARARGADVSSAQKLLAEMAAGLPDWPGQVAEETDVGSAYTGDANLKLDGWRTRMADEIVRLSASGN